MDEVSLGIGIVRYGLVSYVLGTLHVDSSKPCITSKVKWCIYYLGIG